MAPDITPGQSYGAAELTNAIRGSRALILVFSAHSNKSEQVFREVELAARFRIPIVRFRIEQIDPSTHRRSSALACTGWMPTTRPRKKNWDRLAQAVKKWLEVREKPSDNSGSFTPRAGQAGNACSAFV